MARIACLLLLGSLAVSAALESLIDQTQGDQDQGVEDKELIMLEIEALPRTGHGKRAADPVGQSHALFGASPGQFVVRTEDSNAQPQIPPEYLGLLQQLLAQSRSAGHPGAHAAAPPQPPVIQQLVVSRDPDPSVARYSTTPDPSQFLFLDPASGTPTPTPPTPTTRRPLPPEARVQQQLQQLYHDQRQTPRPPVQPQLAAGAALSLHEARLRASLAGDNPDFAALQGLAPTPPHTQADFEDALFQQQLQRLAVQAQQEQAQAVAQAQAAAQAQAQQSPFQQALQQQSVQPQVFPPAPQPTRRQPAYAQQRLEVSTPVPRQTTAAPLFIPEPQELVPQQPPPPQQYLRETTRPRSRRPQQQLIESPRSTLRQQQPETQTYLSTPTPTAAAQNDDIISSLLGQSGRGFFDKSPSTTAASLPSRSSIYVSTTSNLKGSKPGSGITIEELSSTPQAGDDSGALPVVRLPTPEGQRPLTGSELQALIAAGFKVTAIGGEDENPAASLPYYQPSTKRQRSYSTPVPPIANQAIERQHIRKQQQQRQPVPQEEKPQRRPQLSYRQQEQEIPEQVPPSYQGGSQESQVAYQPDFQLVFQQRPQEGQKQTVSTQQPPSAYQPQDLQLVFQRQGGEQAQPSSTTQQPPAEYQQQEVQLVFQQPRGGPRQASSTTQQPPVAYQPQDLQLVFQRQGADQNQQAASTAYQSDVQLVFRQRPEDGQKQAVSTQQPPVAYQPQDLQLVFQGQGGDQSQPAGTQLVLDQQPATRLSPIVVPEQQEEYVVPRRRPAGARRSRQRSRGYRPPSQQSSQESDEQTFASYDSEPAPSNYRDRSVRQRSRRPQPTYES